MCRRVAKAGQHQLNNLVAETKIHDRLNKNEACCYGVSVCDLSDAEPVVLSSMAQTRHNQVSCSAVCTAYS